MGWKSLQLQVINSPFNQEQADLLNRLLSTLTETQTIWLSGYLAGSQYAIPVTQVAHVEQTTSDEKVEAISKEVTILFGSQSGNAHRLAESAGKAFSGRGFHVTLSSMSDFKTNNIKKVQNLFIIVSTHGEGDPPDNAISFYEFLLGRRAPKLDHLNYSVLALGDSSYELFCHTGKEFDIRLEELGGYRLFPRVDCDLDYDKPAAEWIDGVLGSLSEAEIESSALTLTSAKSLFADSPYSRTNPFKAEVLENINLNGRGSNKETRHLEISLEGSGFTFEPGDSLGIFPENDPELVKLLIEVMKWNPDEMVMVNKQKDVLSLKEALTSFFEITVLTKPLLEKAAELSTNKDLRELLSTDNEEKFKSYINGRDLLDLVRDFGPWNGSSQEFVAILRKIPPRLYSIASSFSANPDEVHLTIGTVRYETHGRERNGVCSVLTAERLHPGDTLPIYIQRNQNFKLPKSPDTPIIMIGPGTGVAPFRSFMQEREEQRAKGKSWLFFGDQHFVTDFLYQTEWQKWVREGVLTKMAVAFSRDTNEKVYVQHRLLEHSKELFDWLQAGAVVYICGDKKHMAHDVHHSFLEIIEKEGNMSPKKAEAYLTDMQQQKRYQRDVY